MRIDVFTIFPEAVENMARLSMLGRARDTGLIDVRVHDLRMASTDPHRTVDDRPFGGGAGMVLKPEPAFLAVEAVEPPRPLFLLDPGGPQFDQQKANELATLDGFSLMCGRYEGVDDRIRTNLVDLELSVGDVVLAGGEFAAMVVIEAVTRLVPGVLGNEVSATDETFADHLLEYPQWTRPAMFREFEVPEIVRGGDHELVGRWHRAMAIARTADVRPELLERRGVAREELTLLDEFNISVDPRFVSE